MDMVIYLDCLLQRVCSKSQRERAISSSMVRVHIYNQDVIVQQRCRPEELSKSRAWVGGKSPTTVEMTKTIRKRRDEVRGALRLETKWWRRGVGRNKKHERSER